MILGVSKVDLWILSFVLPFRVIVFFFLTILLGFVKVGISTLGERLVLLVFSLDLPFPLFVSDEGGALYDCASAVLPLALLYSFLGMGLALLDREDCCRRGRVQS